MVGFNTVNRSSGLKNNYKPSPILVILIFLASVFFGVDSSLGFFTSSFVAYSVGASFVAWLIYMTGTPLVGICSAAMAYGISYLLLGCAAYSLASLIILPVGYIFYLVAKNHIPRLQGVYISAVIIAAFEIGIVLFQIHSSFGSISIDNAKQFFSKIIEQMQGYLLSSEIPSNVLESYINIFIVLLPGVYFAVSTVMSTLSSWLFKAILGVTSGERPETFCRWRFEPSPVSGVVLLLSLLVGLLSMSINAYVLCAVMMLLILVPMFFFAGIGNPVPVKIIDGEPKPTLGRLLPLIISFFMSFFAFITVGTFFGLCDSIKRFFPKKNKN